MRIEEKFDACESFSFGFFFAMLYVMGRFNGRSVVALISYTPFLHVLLWRAAHKPRPKEEFIVNVTNNLLLVCAGVIMIFTASSALKSYFILFWFFSLDAIMF